MAENRDVVDLIEEDHREVERLFGELTNTPEKRRLLLPVLTSLLVAHSRAEEAEVYPVARDEAGEVDEVAHSQEEHEEAERLLQELAETDPASGDFEQKLHDLVAAVTHHVNEEESTVLPGMRQRLSDDRRRELGEAFVRTREAYLGEKPGEATRDELEQKARNAGIQGASTMSKDQLRSALKQ